jgi:glycine/D-amino acid oxidase-like deaminating enzyme
MKPSDFRRSVIASMSRNWASRSLTNPYSDVSYWFDSLEGMSEPEVPELPSDAEIAIIGAGFTGLWTAYYLKQKNPELDIAVFEARTVGFGASGRNGGWCMGEAYGLDAYGNDSARREAAMRLRREMFNTVDEVGRVSQAEDIDCHYAKGGWLTVAYLPFHARQIQERIAARHALGFTEDDYRWLPPEEAKSRISIGGLHGAGYARHCAALHPARLARGLGDVVRRKGVRIYERTPATNLQPGLVTTDRGTVAASIILRATEGYTASIKGLKRNLMPLYSMVTATEPLPEDVWAEIGLSQREVFDDPRRLVIYGQRTMDDRLVLGGRAGYFFGSRRYDTIGRGDANVQIVERVVRDLFPVLEDCRITHGWGGLMGVPRHWRPCVSFDQASGMGWAGGYVGEGVAATNLAGRILSDLVLSRDTDLTRLPWVGDEPRRWEIEPLRWIGSNTVRWMAYRADDVEARTMQPSKFWGYWADRLSG